MQPPLRLDRLDVGQRVEVGIVKRRFRTGPTILPPSTRNVPSRVMPVMITRLGWTGFV